VWGGGWGGGVGGGGGGGGGALAGVHRELILPLAVNSIWSCRSLVQGETLLSEYAGILPCRLEVLSPSSSAAQLVQSVWSGWRGISCSESSRCSASSPEILTAIARHRLSGGGGGGAAR